MLKMFVSVIEILVYDSKENKIYTKHPTMKPQNPSYDKIQTRNPNDIKRIIELHKCIIEKCALRCPHA